MRKVLASLAIGALFATAAVAHGGKSHKVMGTVDVVEADQVVLTTTANTEATVLLNAATKYEKEGKVVDRSALVPGARVSIDLSEDDRTAVKVKIGAGGGHHDGHH